MNYTQALQLYKRAAYVAPDAPKLPSNTAKPSWKNALTDKTVDDIIQNPAMQGLAQSVALAGSIVKPIVGELARPAINYYARQAAASALEGMSNRQRRWDRRYALERRMDELKAAPKSILHFGKMPANEPPLQLP